jgi:hypothetical protein
MHSGNPSRQRHKAMTVQNAEHPPDSRFWDDRATEVIAEARKMPLGERRRAALREAGRLRIAAELNRWLANK